MKSRRFAAAALVLLAALAVGGQLLLLRVRPHASPALAESAFAAYMLTFSLRTGKGI